jgi:hypothetical protein
MLQLLRNTGGIGVLGMAVAVATVAVAAAYAIRPAERRLALMRPLSLATIFAALCTFASGVAMVFDGISTTAGPIGWSRVAAGAAESVAPMAGAFGCLTIAWMLVAVGLRRHP